MSLGKKCSAWSGSRSGMGRVGVVLSGTGSVLSKSHEASLDFSVICETVKQNDRDEPSLRKNVSNLSEYGDNE